MRFQLPSTIVSHPAGARVRRVSIDPLHQSGVWAAVEGNNEVSLWDLETQARLRTLWASTAPPLSEKQAHPSAQAHSVYSMYISPLECGPFMLTAGSDMRIRLWDINNPLASHVVAGSATDTLTPSFSYKSSLIDGTKVIQEVYSSRPKKDQPNTEQPKRHPEQPPTGHNDCISDIGVVQTTSQTFIVSASKNGVVKVWK
uniref:Putative phosphoinositide 3-kin n=1 Tax=Amblyomma triste TaxID=251400 RepID=A0A023GJ19_AMBTT